MTSKHNGGDDGTGRSGRWLRRETRKRQERRRLKKHGAGLRRVYLDAVRKRAQERADGKAT